MTTSTIRRLIPSAVLSRRADPHSRHIAFADLPSAIVEIHRRLGRPSDDRFRSFIEMRGVASRLDYERDALEFNRTFFLRNAVKCLIMATMLDGLKASWSRGPIFDMGGGIGTFTLAVADRRPWSDRFVVERSPAQTALGRRLVDNVDGAAACWLPSEHHLLPASATPLALFSFSLCESPDLLTSVRATGPCAALVVDYPEIVDACAVSASETEARFVRRRFIGLLDEQLADAIGQPTVSVDGGMIVFD